MMELKINSKLNIVQIVNLIHIHIHRLVRSKYRQSSHLNTYGRYFVSLILSHSEKNHIVSFLVRSVSFDILFQFIMTVIIA